MSFDHTGQVFGRIHVSHYSHRNTQGDHWVCWCECDPDTTYAVRGSRLRSGNSRSCGRCFRRIKHGDCHSPEYKAWDGMLYRCYNENCEHFDAYGGRGIGVCDRWRYSYENFLEDMGRRPSRLHSIDRYPDNDGDYCKENCRWATKSQQNSNRRRANRI